MIEVKKGAADQTFYFKLVDDTTGSAKSGLTVTAIDATYVRTRSAAVKNDCTAASSADAAHSDNTAFEVDSTNAPGLYRIDYPDAAFTTGAAMVVLVATHVSCDPAMQMVSLVDNVSGELATGAIAASSFAANAINASAIAADAIDASAIAASAITSAKFAAGAINASAIASDAIGASAIAASAITSAKFAAGAVNASAIAADAITATKFAQGAINASAIASDAIGASAIAADAITAAKLANNAITAAKIADGAIDNATFAADAIGSTALAASAVSEIWTTALTESYAADGAAFTGAQALFQLWALAAEKAITSTTLTANQLDGATPAMTFSLSDATSPISITRAT